MKKHYCVFLICIYILGHASFGQTSSIDILSYELEAKCNLDKRKIDITANLSIQKNLNISSCKLLLGSWVHLKSIKSGNVPVKYSRKSVDDDTLFISVPAQFMNDNKLELSFDYTLPLDTLDAKNKNLVFLQSGVFWYPFLRNDIASMKLIIYTPDNFYVFFTGDLIEKKTSLNSTEFHFENGQNNRYALYLIKSDTFSTTKTKNIENININFYFVLKDTAIVNQIINEMCTSFSFYSKYIGSYKHKQLQVVEIPDSRVLYAQSSSTIIIMGSPFITAYELQYGDWPAHEVAHQWWGNGIFTDAKGEAGLFLEEVVNEYFKALYVENTMGIDSLKKLLESYQDTYNEIDTSKELSILDITNVSAMKNGYVIYQKGPLIINKLKNMMGAVSYQNFIKEIYVQYFGKLLTFDDFIKVLSKYDKNNNLVNSLIKWLSETGYAE